MFSDLVSCLNMMQGAQSYGAGAGMATMRPQMYGMSGGKQGSGRPDFKEGRLFVGGLNFATTQRTLQEYCQKWCGLL